MVTRSRVLLFKRRIMLFVQNNNIKIKRRKNCTACSKHNLSRTVEYGQVTSALLRSRECRMQHNYRNFQIVFKTRRRLRSKPNFRHENEYTLIALKRFAYQFLINSRLATAGHTMQKRSTKTVLIQIIHKTGKCSLLFSCQGGQVRTDDHFRSNRWSLTPRFSIFFSKQGIKILIKICRPKYIQCAHGRCYIILSDPFQRFHITSRKDVSRLMRACIPNIKSRFFIMNAADQGKSGLTPSQLHPDNTSPHNIYTFRHPVSKNRWGQGNIDFAKTREKRRIAAFLNHLWSRCLGYSFSHGAKIVLLQA